MSSLKLPSKNMIIKGRTIGKDSPIFLIAEAGVNHNGEIDKAKKLIDLAAKAQVDAIKFQTFITDKLILKTTSKVNYQKKSDEDKENFYDMVKKYELSKEHFKILNDFCSAKEIIFLSTPFDEISVEWLEELNISAFKIGSGDMNNYPLLKLICSKKKPIFLSTGMATLKEVKKSVEYIKSNGNNDLAIFQCTTNYPASFKELNLNVIDTYKQIFPDAIIGFSDHSLGIEASIGAAAKGVKIIEKHFTLDKTMEGPDHKASLNPEELIRWVKSIRNIEKALGSSKKDPTKNELEIAKIARKSIVSLKNLEGGEIITEKNVGIKRPGTGIPPTKFYDIINKKMRIKKSIPKDTVINWEDIE